MRRAGPGALLLACLAIAGTLAGCRNPDASPARSAGEQGPGGAGEPAPPAAPSSASQRPSEVKRSPQAALTAFAQLYVNWDYRDLSARQRLLTAIAVGAARLAETQAAAASAGDPNLRAGRIANSGQVVSVAADLQARGRWVIVTSERTSGSEGYQALPASLHVTFARLAAVPGGFAVSEWLPQS